MAKKKGPRLGIEPRTTSNFHSGGKIESRKKYATTTPPRHRETELHPREGKKQCFSWIRCHNGPSIAAKFKKGHIRFRQVPTSRILSQNDDYILISECCGFHASIYELVFGNFFSS